MGPLAFLVEIARLEFSLVCPSLQMKVHPAFFLLRFWSSQRLRFPPEDQSRRVLLASSSPGLALFPVSSWMKVVVSPAFGLKQVDGPLGVF